MTLSDDPPAPDELDITALMHSALPSYVVKCLILAGYDEKEVIKSMDTSEKVGNSISMIEQYIEERHKDDPDLIPGVSTTHPEFPFQFPPGHRIRICNFVRKVKDMCKDYKSFDKQTCNSDRSVAMIKKCKVATTDASRAFTEPLSAKEIACQVHGSIHKWTQQPKNAAFRLLEDGTHFSVHIIEEAKHCFSVKVTCTSCHTAIRLQKINQHYQISNWTKHVKNCATPTKNLSSQSKLNQLLLKGSLTSTERKRKSSCVNSQLPVSNAAKSSKCSENSKTVCTENISKYSANNAFNTSDSQVFQ